MHHFRMLNIYVFIKFSRTFDVEKIYFIKLNLFQENFYLKKKHECNIIGL